MKSNFFNQNSNPHKATRGGSHLVNPYVFFKKSKRKIEEDQKYLKNTTFWINPHKISKSQYEDKVKKIYNINENNKKDWWHVLIDKETGEMIKKRVAMSNHERNKRNKYFRLNNLPFYWRRQDA